MKQLIGITLLLLCAGSIKAQPGLEHYPRHVTFGLYTSQGVVIDTLNKEYEITFSFNPFTWKSSRSEHNGVRQENLSSKEIPFKDNKYGIKTTYYGEVKIVIIKGEDTMIIFTEISLDSIAFCVCKYKIQRDDANLVNSLDLYGNAKLQNFSLEKLKLDQENKKLFYRSDNIQEDILSREKNVEKCIEFAEKLESYHGDKNWVMNICNTSYKRREYSSLHVRKISFEWSKGYNVKIYPIKKKAYFKHELFDNEYQRDYHVFSISYDEGLTWEKLFSVKNQSYLDVVYLNDLEQIGISWNFGLLISNYNDLSNWTYYYPAKYDYFDDKNPKKYIGLNLNMDQEFFGNPAYFETYYFDESIELESSPTRTVNYEHIANSRGYDIIVMNKDTLYLLNTPLSYRSDFDSLRQKMFTSNASKHLSGVLRNDYYIAQWAVIDKELYLTHVFVPKNEFENQLSDYIELDLKPFFGEAYKDGKIKANWVSQNLQVHNGNLIHYLDNVFESIFERVHILTIKKGKLKGHKKYDNSRSYRSIYAINRDSLYHFIYSNINWNNIPDLKESGKRVVISLYTGKSIKPNVNIVNENDTFQDPDFIKYKDTSELYEIISQEVLKAFKLLPHWNYYYRQNKSITVKFEYTIYVTEETRKRYAR